MDAVSNAWATASTWWRPTHAASIKPVSISKIKAAKSVVSPATLIVDDTSRSITTQVDLAFGMRSLGAKSRGVACASGRTAPNSWTWDSSTHNFCPLPTGVVQAAPNLFEPSARESREHDQWLRHTKRSLDFAAQVKARAEKHAGPEEAAIFDVQVTILSDAELLQRVEMLIHQQIGAENVFTARRGSGRQ